MVLREISATRGQRQEKWDRISEMGLGRGKESGHGGSE